MAWLGAAWTLDRWGRRRPPPVLPFSAIIVAGCPALPDGRPSVALRRRVEAAMIWMRHYPSALLVCTGAGSPFSEASVARALALELGCAAGRIRVEEASTSTWENAQQAAALLRSEQLSPRVVVVSDGWHVFRCMMVFRTFFEEVQPWGAPGPSRWGPPLREVVALLLYALRGRLHRRFLLRGS